MTLEKQLDCRNQALQMIVDIGLDYDGFHTAEDLKALVDELIKFAQDGLNDKFPQYIGQGTVKEFHEGKFIEVPEEQWSKESQEWMKLFKENIRIHKGT
jgi:hypothetical protein